MNTDASVREQVASGGGVLRDSTGKVIFAFYKEFGELEVLSAEASALLFGLQLCVDGGFRQVQVEVDSEVLVKLVLSQSLSKWPLCNTLIRICDLLGAIQAGLSHIFRQANAVVDCLASLSLPGQHVFSSSSQLPPKVRHSLRIDGLGIPSLRSFVVRE